MASIGVYLVPACGHSDHGETNNPDLADVVYEGKATDEALQRLLSTSATEDLTGPPEFSVPSNNAVIPESTWPTFTWKLRSTATGRNPAKRPDIRRTQRFAWGAERTAHAHGTPVNGRAYYLLFANAAGEPVLRVFTTASSYAPSGDPWQKLVNAGGPITATLTTALYEDNNIVPNSGPNRGPSIAFTVTK